MKIAKQHLDDDFMLNVNITKIASFTQSTLNYYLCCIIIFSINDNIVFGQIFKI